MARCHAAQLWCGFHIIPGPCNHGGHNCSDGSRDEVLQVDRGNHQQVSICPRSSSVTNLWTGAGCFRYCSCLHIPDTPHERIVLEKGVAVWKRARLVKRWWEHWQVDWVLRHLHGCAAHSFSGTPLPTWEVRHLLPSMPIHAACYNGITIYQARCLLTQPCGACSRIYGRPLLVQSCPGGRGMDMVSFHHADSYGCPVWHLAAASCPLSDRHRGRYMHHLQQTHSS